MTQAESTSAAYDALRKRARSRIDKEWDVTGREKIILDAIEVLSFGCGAMKAYVRSQVFLAKGTELHKSDVCRALGRLMKIGALSRYQTCGRTFYAIEVDCKTVPRKTAVPETERNGAWATMLEDNLRREGGRADATGQLKLHGIEEPEDQHLEREALAAMMEAEPQSGRASEPEIRPEADAAGDAAGFVGPMDAETQREWAALRSRLDTGSVAAARPTAAAGSGPTAQQIEAVEACKRGLSFEQGILWDDLVKELRRGDQEDWRSFVQYAGLWRMRLLDNPLALREAVSDHKLRSDGPADRPGKYLYKMYVARGGRASFSVKANSG